MIVTVIRWGGQRYFSVKNDIGVRLNVHAAHLSPEEVIAVLERLVGQKALRVSADTIVFRGDVRSKVPCPAHVEDEK